MFGEGSCTASQASVLFVLLGGNFIKHPNTVLKLFPDMSYSVQPEYEIHVRAPTSRAAGA